jgi:hypothetical protein
MCLIKFKIFFKFTIDHLLKQPILKFWANVPLPLQCRHVLFYPLQKNLLRIFPCNVDYFILPPSVDFFFMWQGESHCHISKVTFLLTWQCTFADVTMTFSMPHQQKVNGEGKTKLLTL